MYVLVRKSLSTTRVPLKPREKKRTQHVHLLANNSQHYWILHVASVCSPCYMLLRVVGNCCTKFETGQTFELTSPNISFVP